MSVSVIQSLQELANDFADRSYAPYSERQAGCIALLSDGHWVPGVRVENASFPLTISATLNALTTAIAAGRSDLVAFVASRPFTHAERDLLEPFLAHLRVRENVASSSDELPAPIGMLEMVSTVKYADPMTGIEEARRTADRAWIPESDFPVGCILGSPDGGYVKGVNVEHPDWNLSLCAERNAIGTAVTYRLSHPTEMFLSCTKEPAGTPCGACRQVMVEHVPDLRLVMDRGTNAPEATTPVDLLPNFFAGESLRNK